MDWLYTLSGFFVGFIVGITGVGGGSVMTPLLILGFGIAPATAVGTDLLYASLTKLGGIGAHSFNGTVEWKVVGRLALGSIPAALLSIAVLKALALDELHLRGLITSAISVALVLSALGLLLKPYVLRFARVPHGAGEELQARNLQVATVLTGAVVGTLVTVSSVGAGVLGTATLLFLYPRFSAARIIGTELAHAVPLTLVAGLGHAALGTVKYSLLASLLAGSLPGIYLGTRLGVRMPERVLRPLLASMLLLIGGRMLAE